MTDSSSPPRNHWTTELTELVSGASGGFLFGVPLLYTVEVWSIGSFVAAPALLAIIALTYILVWLFDTVEGFRQHHGSPAESARETIEALAIGIVCATTMLALLDRINFNTPLLEALGKVVFESVPFSLGVALSRSILADHSEDGENGDSSYWTDTLSDLSATLFGAIVIAFSIAPTEEVPVLAAAASPGRLLAIVACSLLVSYGIVFASGFTNQSKRRHQTGLFQTPESETIVSYLLALLASALMLWFFQQLSTSDPWFLWLRYSLVLGLPAAIGGAAGRLTV